MIASPTENKRTSEQKTEEVLGELNNLLDCWVRQFDKPPAAPFVFRANEHNQLTAGDAVVGDLSNISLDELSFDYEHLYLSTNGIGQFYRITFDWRYEKEPVVKEICLVMYGV